MPLFKRKEGAMTWKTVIFKWNRWYSQTYERTKRQLCVVQIASLCLRKPEFDEFENSCGMFRLTD